MALADLAGTFTGGGVLTLAGFTTLGLAGLGFVRLGNFGIFGKVTLIRLIFNLVLGLGGSGTGGNGGSGIGGNGGSGTGGNGGGMIGT